MPESSGLGESRITARMMPPTTPMIMASAVSSNVTSMPCTMLSWKRYFPTMSHLKAGLVKRALSSIAASRAMTTAPAQRPGWRTGTALMVSGRPFAAFPLSREFTVWPRGRESQAEGQLTAPLTVDLSIAPASTPHLERICL